MSEVIESTAQNGRKHSESSDSEYDPQFKPVITLPEVEVWTNEENESEMLKIRAKLYRFDSHEHPPEWKERGTGELKILRHKENNSVRVVMRRDKTLKVCANHFITPWMELKPSVGNEKAFIYNVLADFADELAKSECLAVKFGTIDNANLFKKTFEEAKNLLKTECDLYNGKGDKENESDSSLSDNENDTANESTKSQKKNEECEDLTEKIKDLEVTNKIEK